eukprot:jgi/Mesvir1/26677/Mv20459-RA.1
MQAVQARRRGVKDSASLKQSGHFDPIVVGILLSVLCGVCYHRALEHHVLFASSGMQMTTDLKAEFAEEFRQHFELDKEADEMAVRVRSKEDPYVTEKWVPTLCGGCNKTVQLNFENLYAGPPAGPHRGGVPLLFRLLQECARRRAVAMHFPGYSRPDNWFKIEGESDMPIAGQQTYALIFTNAFKDAKIPSEFAAGIPDARRKKARKAAIAAADPNCLDCDDILPNGVIAEKDGKRSCAVNFPGFAGGDSWFKVNSAARHGSFFFDYLPEDLPLYHEYRATDGETFSGV